MRSPRVLASVLIAMMGVVGCAADEVSREGCGDGATCATSSAASVTDEAFPDSQLGTLRVVQEFADPETSASDVQHLATAITTSMKRLDLDVTVTVENDRQVVVVVRNVTRSLANSLAPQEDPAAAAITLPVQITVVSNTWTPNP